jgi:myosin heavy subunit
VFYYLLAGANDVEKQEFHLGLPEEYFYLNKVCEKLWISWRLVIYLGWSLR